MSLTMLKVLRIIDHAFAGRGDHWAADLKSGGLKQRGNGSGANHAQSAKRMKSIKIKTIFKTSSIHCKSRKPSHSNFQHHLNLFWKQTMTSHRCHRSQFCRTVQQWRLREERAYDNNNNNNSNNNNDLGAAAPKTTTTMTWTSCWPCNKIIWRIKRIDAKQLLLSWTLIALTKQKYYQRLR